ncbi:CheR family methyltransferase [uncultured Castellaniella sp.]|jgi:chemotaxis protein methyltransferase CheR|uniref:CheR family methyltransferase n=1 Tax=uncultured Castellaniella sp. TaxID=647907 RepID=UPI002626C3AE|nr:CheR family methyltransferase [uncultured Castellaniella sp.]
MIHDAASVSYFSQPALPKADAQDLGRTVDLLHKRAGIVLGDHKKDMAARTLGLRAHHAGLGAVRDYLNYLEQNPQSEEWDRFISAFTINHTAFFREQHHFQILADFVRTRRKPISIWCCASSTGEEPYTLAMTLHDACGQSDAGISVLATDIDLQVLAQARKGVYTLDRIKPIPPEFLRRYFLRGTGRQAGMAMVKPVIRNLVTFEELNLVAPAWPISQKFDAIFCRNTMIYFDKPTQTRILERFVPLLKPGGLMFAGHSENFTYLTKSLRLQGQTVYALA